MELIDCQSCGGTLAHNKDDRYECNYCGSIHRMEDGKSQLVKSLTLENAKLKLKIIEEKKEEFDKQYYEIVRYVLPVIFLLVLLTIFAVSFVAEGIKLYYKGAEGANSFLFLSLITIFPPPVLCYILNLLMNKSDAVRQKTVDLQEQQESLEEIVIKYS